MEKRQQLMEGALLCKRRVGQSNAELLPWLLVILSMVSVIAVGGAPILGPDLNNCLPVIPPKRTSADAVDCCFVDIGRPIIDFQFDPNLPMRVRRPAHKLDEEFVRKYERAYEIMRSLPQDDPRSWHAQSNLHCAYCAAAYTQANSSAVLDTHHGWLLMPFHRWYVYFHERILASLIGDDTFAIPYWAWDFQNENSPPANTIPSIFTDKNSSLYDKNRCHIHQPPHRVDLKIQVEKPYNKEPHQLKKDNIFNMWRVMIGEVHTPEAFFGGKYSLGDQVTSKAGRFETGPHAAVHGWTGDETAIFGEDMAPAYTAARDPIFFAHHSQVDRLWQLWNKLGGRNFDDPDWLRTEFLFYDENSNMVRVNVQDSLDIDKLRVRYEQEPAEWLHYSPKSLRKTNPKFSRRGMPSRPWRNIWGSFDATERFLSFLGSSRRDAKLLKGRVALTSRIFRPDASSRSSLLLKTDGKASVFEEVLVMEGVVTKPFDIKVLVNIFLDLPEADESTPLDCAESLGNFYLEPEGRRDQETTIRRQFSQYIGIGSRFPLLDISDEVASVMITFVPAWEKQYDNQVTVEFMDLRIELHIVP